MIGEDAYWERVRERLDKENSIGGYEREKEEPEPHDVCCKCGAWLDPGAEFCEKCGRWKNYA